MIQYLLIFFAAVNFFCFVRVGADKRLSKKSEYGGKADDRQRMSEVSLISYSAFGGAIGTLLGFKVFRHKMSGGKRYLRRNLYIIFIENIVLYSSLYFNFII